MKTEYAFQWKDYPAMTERERSGFVKVYRNVDDDALFSRFRTNISHLGRYVSADLRNHVTCVEYAELLLAELDDLDELVARTNPWLSPRWFGELLLIIGEEIQRRFL